MERLIVHITGARPNFPKAAPVIKALSAYPVRQLLVHTGQHYDDRLSEVFFAELDLPRPDINLGVGSGSHAEQTAAVMLKLEPLFSDVRPDIVVVYGDINSTLAAALVAAKMGITLAHVEAGLRSFDMTMPEEVNRRVTDQLADVLFATSPDAVAHLADEGIPWQRIHLVGNPMIDTLLAHLDRFDAEKARARFALVGPYVVATLHRPGNVDAPDDVRRLIAALDRMSQMAPILLPLHPRGRANLERAGLSALERIHVIDPLPYTEFMSAIRGSSAVLTDSGGVQEETTILGVPCLTLRPNTERPITITNGTNRLVSPESAPQALAELLGTPELSLAPEPPPLWDGRAGGRIARILSSVAAGPRV